jgi:small subunit ribosomal protein S8
MSMTRPHRGHADTHPQRARRPKARSTCRSKVKAAIAKVLKDEGYITDFSVEGRGRQAAAHDRAQIFRGQAGDRTIRRVSRPGLRVYKRPDDLPKVMGGLGIAIVSAPPPA